MAGVGMKENGNTYYYIMDRLGNVRYVVNSSGAIVQSYLYTPFGQVHSSSGSLSQPYQYVGGEGYYTEETMGLQLLGQRWYDEEVGRFISRDPIGEEGGLNLYVYVGNNPVNEIDPNGRFISRWEVLWDVWDWIISQRSEIKQKLNVKRCIEEAKRKGGLIPLDPVTNPTASKNHCFVSCEINRCLFNLLPGVTLAGGIWVEVEDWKKDSWSDIKADIKGILCSYTFKSCKECCGIEDHCEDE